VAHVPWLVGVVAVVTLGIYFSVGDGNKSVKNQAVFDFIIHQNDLPRFDVLRASRFQEIPMPRRIEGVHAGPFSTKGNRFSVRQSGL